MKFTYHTMTEHPEVGKKVAIVEVCGYSYEDRCFAVWNGEKWDFARKLCDFVLGKEQAFSEPKLF